MRSKVSKACSPLLIILVSLFAFGQKVKVGYDRKADFPKFKTYSWAQPMTPPTRPLLYMIVVDTIDYELKPKGLLRVDDEGDLTLIPAGGMEFGLNMAADTPFVPTRGGGPPPAIDSTMWTGGTGFSQLTAPAVPEASLVLTFVDRAANKIIWTGTVTDKLDLQDKKESLERVDKAIVKLLRQFPPRQK